MSRSTVLTLACGECFRVLLMSLWRAGEALLPGARERRADMHAKVHADVQEGID